MEGGVKSAVNSLKFWGEPNDDSRSKVGTEGRIVHQGWLLKRGPTTGYSWQKRWCVVRQGSLTYYADDTCQTKKGTIEITDTSVAVSFVNSGAPGDALTHRGERPNGFLIDGDPDAGPGRRLFYFDAENPALLKQWLQVLQQVVKTEMAKKAPRVAAGTASTKVAPMQSGLQTVDSLLDTLHGKAIGIQIEAGRQQNLIDDVSQKTDDVQAKMTDQVERMKKLGTS